MRMVRALHIELQNYTSFNMDGNCCFLLMLKSVCLIKSSNTVKLINPLYNCNEFFPSTPIYILIYIDNDNTDD